MIIRASVIMPVKNGERFIRESLESLIQNISGQDEIIIINDGSSDKTVDIANNFIKSHKNISIYHGDNLMPSGARNLGLERSKGNLISFIDHDDLWPKGRLDHHLNILSQSSELDVIQGMVKYFSSEPEQLKKFTFLDENKSIFFFQLGSFTFKRKVFEEIGFFNPELKFGEDVDLYSRMLDNKINMIKDPDIALLYRIHDTNMTHNYIENNNNVLIKILSNSIKRKREKILND